MALLNVNRILGVDDTYWYWYRGIDEVFLELLSFASFSAYQQYQPGRLTYERGKAKLFDRLEWGVIFGSYIVRTVKSCSI